MRLAKEPDALPKNILTPEEARRIIEAPDTQTLIGYRDRTLLEVLYATGIRKAELRNLTVEAVNLEEELLRVNKGKGGKDRVVPLSRIACQYLENYIKAIRPELLKGRHTDKLFVSIRNGMPIGVNGIGRIIDKYVRLARRQKARDLPPVAAQLRHAPVEEQRQPAARSGNARPQVAGDHRALSAADHHRLEGGAPQVPSPGAAAAAQGGPIVKLCTLGLLSCHPFSRRHPTSAPLLPNRGEGRECAGIAARKNYTGGL